MAEGGSKLSEEEIFECLKSLNVPVRMNDLKVPSREFIIRVFECFLKDLQIDVSQEFRNWDTIKHIEDGDICEEALTILLLAMNVNHIFNPCGLNITIKDINEPKPKRTKKILNHLLIFWNYYLKKYGRFCALEETFENEKKIIEDILQEDIILDEKYNDALQKLNDLQPSKDELSSISRANEEKLAKLTDEAAILKTNYEGLKTKELSLRKEIDATDLNIIKEKERLHELSQLILSSPNQKRINTEIQTLEDKIKAKDVEARECEIRCKDAVKNLQLLEEVEKEKEKVLNALIEASEIDKQFRGTVKSMVDIHQKIDEEENRLKRLHMDLERKENWKHQQEQKSTQIVVHNRKHVQALKEHLKMSEKEEEEVKSDIDFIKAAVEAAQDSIDSESDHILVISRRCKEASAQSKERETQFISKLKDITDKFKGDCSDVCETIKKTFSELPAN